MQPLFKCHHVITPTPQKKNKAPLYPSCPHVIAYISSFNSVISVVKTAIVAAMSNFSIMFSSPHFQALTTVL